MSSLLKRKCSVWKSSRSTCYTEITVLKAVTGSYPDCVVIITRLYSKKNNRTHNQEKTNVPGIIRHTGTRAFVCAETQTLEHTANLCNLCFTLPENEFRLQFHLNCCVNTHLSTVQLPIISVRLSSFNSFRFNWFNSLAVLLVRAIC